MPVKRKRQSSYKRVMLRQTPRGRGRIATTARFMGVRIGSQRSVRARVSRIESMIETKEMQTRSAVNQSLPHNNVTVVQMVEPVGADMNPFYCSIGPNDPMSGIGVRIGDKITVKGVLIRGFFENALQRAKVYYRVMLVRRAKGDSLDRSTLFRGDANNKMIDLINTERYTIVAQKTFNIAATNTMAATVGLTGVPATGTPAGIATKTFKMWIPGSKFGRNGNLTYENNNVTGQLKFYDYRLVIVAYDWYGTPQDENTVGKINELYTKVYFKDA